jgi:hypothetical protein
LITASITRPTRMHGLASKISDFLGTTLADSRVHGLASKPY